jgi:hypothetical protein
VADDVHYEGPLQTAVTLVQSERFGGIRPPAYSAMSIPAHGWRMQTSTFARNTVERLEDRIAPATLLPGGKVVTFTDGDGDAVTVKLSKPILTEANVGSIFQFDTVFGDSGPQLLKALELYDLGPAANGVDVTVTAHRSATSGGNGLVHIGAFDASNINLSTGTGAGIDLGKVRIQGSVNFLDAGDPDPATPAAKSIDVRSIGFEVPGIQSDFHGGIGKLIVRGDMAGHILVKSGVAKSVADLRIGSITITGSLVGTGFNSGYLEVGEIGRVKILGDIKGGDGEKSGRIQAQNIDNLTVLGSLGGGGGFSSGTISVSQVNIAKIGGSLHGGTAETTGTIFGNFDVLTIGGDLVGTDPAFTGLVQAGTLGKVIVHGNIFGGGGASSGRIAANDMDSVVVRGSVIGGAGLGSATISANTIDSVKIGGDLIGGSGDFSAQIFGGGKLREIKGSVLGVLTASGDGNAAAGIYASIFGIDKIAIGGDFFNANIAVGVGDGLSDSYGDGDDGRIDNNITVTIAELVIKGRAATNIAGVSFGIEANAFGTINISGVQYTDGDPGISFANGFRTDPISSPLVRVVA